MSGYGNRKTNQNTLLDFPLPMDGFNEVIPYIQLFPFSFESDMSRSQLVKKKNTQLKWM